MHLTGTSWLEPGLLVQVVPAAEKRGVAAAEGAALVEVGPRACLMPIRIFAGSFGGPVLYENPAYVSPNKARCRPYYATHMHPALQAITSVKMQPACQLCSQQS